MEGWGGGENLGELSSEYIVLYIQKKPFYFQLKSLNTHKKEIDVLTSSKVDPFVY